MVYIGWERRKTEEKFVVEGQKKRRQTAEKRYKEKVNKENGNRKRSTKGKVATERVRMGKSRDKKGRATGWNNKKKKDAWKEKFYTVGWGGWWFTEKERGGGYGWKGYFWKFLKVLFYV
jgi:hypothetical protein